MANPVTILATGAAVAESLCNPPQLSLVVPSFDILALLVAALEALGIQIPKFPTIQLPSPPCGLD